MLVCSVHAIFLAYSENLGATFYDQANVLLYDLVLSSVKYVVFELWLRRTGATPKWSTCRTKNVVNISHKQEKQFKMWQAIIFCVSKNTHLFKMAQDTDKLGNAEWNNSVLVAPHFPPHPSSPSLSFKSRNRHCPVTLQHTCVDGIVASYLATLRRSRHWSMTPGISQQALICFITMRLRHIMMTSRRQKSKIYWWDVGRHQCNKQVLWRA